MTENFIQTTFGAIEAQQTSLQLNCPITECPKELGRDTALTWDQFKQRLAQAFECRNKGSCGRSVYLNRD